MADVFISYAKESRGLAALMGAWLESRGLTVWWDFELVGGRAFRKQILEELLTAKAVVLIWCPHAVQSTFVHDEADEAQRHDKLIPLRRHDIAVGDLPLGFRQHQTLPLDDLAGLETALIGRGLHLQQKDGQRKQALVSAAPKMTNQPVIPAREASEAERHWIETVKDSTNPAILRAFEEKFATDFHANLARARREELEHAARDALETQRVAEGYIEIKIGPGNGNDEPRWVLPGGGLTVEGQFCDIPGVTPELAVIPAGTFMMGSPEGEGEADEHPQQKITVPKPFAVSRVLTTAGEFLRGTHNVQRSGYREPTPGYLLAWDEAHNYANWLSRKTGKTYRLLTEAEWEYACRAGTTTAYSFGDDVAHLSDYGWYDENSPKELPDVGCLEPNPWGLYDMHGYVGEWVEDCYAGGYDGLPPAVRERAKARQGAFSNCNRVIRGGGLRQSAIKLRSAARDLADPRTSLNIFGIRLARDLS